MRKIERARQLLLTSGDLFQCPLCREGLRPNEGFSLVCPKRHTFDLSRTGSLYLYPNRRAQDKYTRNLFEARQALSRDGFFDPLIRRIAELGLDRLRRSGEATWRVLDAGCGEGSHFARLVRLWREERYGDATGVVGVGIDLSKEAIRLASASYPGLLWCVADLSRCPLRSEAFDLVLNLFSPANYAEMSRLLPPGGTLIKVVPGADYLAELRQLLYTEKEKRHYANDRMIALFREHFSMAETVQVRYRHPLRPGELERLIRMTPLAWGARERDVQQALRADLDAVTVDAVILVGTKSGGAGTSGQ